MWKLLTIAIALGVSACGSGAGASAPPDAWSSTCGRPGDTGNELGVGQFCQSLTDCASTPNARLCSNIGDQTTWFCTKTCQQTDPAGVCGTGATCTCGNGGCGCTPNSCL